ncbi:MAG: PrgI family protein, partial [Acidimicrobiaceae bacterium]|nr:PrgI family protein [Acidimicrobiaceae bacterium]
MMVTPSRIFLSRPSSNRVLLGLNWREIYYLGGGVIAGILCSFYAVSGMAGLLLIVMLPAFSLALAKVKLYGLSPAKAVTRAISLRIKPLSKSPAFDRSGRNTRPVDPKGGGRGTRPRTSPTSAPKIGHRSELDAPTHKSSSGRSPTIRVLGPQSSVAMVTNGARDAVVYQASYCPTWSKVTEEAAAESQIWASSIMDQCRKLPRGARVILRVEVLPEPTLSP